MHFAKGQLKTKESSMALIHVVTRDIFTRGTESTNPSDTEENFLKNSVLNTATVQVSSDVPVIGEVPFYIRIEEVDGDSTHLGDIHTVSYTHLTLPTIYSV